MRGNKYSLLLLLSLMVIPIGFAAAANTQGLSWGVAVDDEFRFNVHVEAANGYTTSITEVVIITITSTPTIPDTVSMTNIVYAGTTTEFENGTDASLGYLGYQFVLPVGNWPMFTTLFTEAMELLDESTIYDSFEGSIIDSLSIWGYTMTFTVSGYDTQVVTHFSKADGLINYMSMRMDYTDIDDYSLMTITREGYLGGTLGFDPMIAIIGVIGVVAVIIIIVILKKR